MNKFKQTIKNKLNQPKFVLILINIFYALLALVSGLYLFSQIK